MTAVDRELAAKYGSFASFETEASPALVDHHGDDPSAEMERVLDVHARPDSHVLDIGCGAGQITCRVASTVKEIWGIDRETDLLEGARQRVEALGRANVTLVAGDVKVAADVDRMPDGYFELAYSRHGPNLNT